MMRRLALLSALVVAGVLAQRLYGDTRYALRADEPLAFTLGAGRSLAGTVVLVLQPEDCFGSGEMLERWGQLGEEVPVLGMVVGDGELSPRQAELYRELRLAFPTRGITAENAARVGEALGYRTTPFAVVLDSQGRVAASFPADRYVPPDVLRALIGV